MHKNFIIFFLIMLSVYTLLNIYLYIRCAQALSLNTPGKIIMGVLLFLLASGYILSHIFGQYLPFGVVSWVQIVGTTWYFFMVYALMAVLLIDLLRIVHHFFHIFPAFLYVDYAKTKLITFCVVMGSITLLAIIGHIRFCHPKVTTLELNIADEHPQHKTMNIAVVSDLHLGYIIRKHRLEKYVEQINSLHPDLILMVGDEVDNDPRPVIHQRMHEELLRLKAPLGVLAVTGNHEYIGNVEASCTYLEQQAGIRFLRDSAWKADNGLYIVGREDRSDKQRKSLPDLMRQVPPDNAVLLLDHQPYHLDESEAHHVNIHLSGHTHDGQFFPINLIARGQYEVSYGYKRKGGTHVYVTSGLGLWGPMIRLGTVSEIVLLKIAY